MKVGIDTLGLEHGQSGLGSYLFYLMKNISYNEKIQVELFGQEPDRYTYKSNFDIEYVPINVSDSLKAQQNWHFWKAKRFINSRKYDVVIFCAGIRMLPPKFLPDVKTVAIVNDILSYKTSKTSQTYLSSFRLNVLKKVTKIVVPTNYVKNDLMKYGILENQIVVIENGIDHSVFYTHNILENDYIDIKPFAIKKPYLIYPTRISESGKKHIQLIKAFTKFKKKTNLPHRLVLAGGHDLYASELQDAILSSDYASDIFVTGFFPHSELGSLYSNATACIFPSAVEGVGLPIIETMACGIPVACASSAALPEIAGNCAVLFDPNDIDQIENSIEKVTIDNQLRQKLVKDGLAWSSKFTWKNTADKILDLLLKL